MLAVQLQSATRESSVGWYFSKRGFRLSESPADTLTQAIGFWLITSAAREKWREKYYLSCIISIAMYVTANNNVGCRIKQDRKSDILPLCWCLHPVQLYSPGVSSSRVLCPTASHSTRGSQSKDLLVWTRRCGWIQGWTYRGGQTEVGINTGWWEVAGLLGGVQPQLNGDEQMDAHTWKKGPEENVLTRN